MTDTLRIGPVDFAVVREHRCAEGDALADGVLESRRCRIRLDQDLDPQQELVTRWHEAVHEMLGQAGRGETEDEVLVSVLSTAIVQVLRDNPTMRGGQLWDSRPSA